MRKISEKLQEENKERLMKCFFLAYLGYHNGPGILPVGIKFRDSHHDKNHTRGSHHGLMMHHGKLDHL